LLYGKIYSKYYYYFLKIYEKTYNTLLWVKVLNLT
jgi:hypothetical protein